MLRPRRRPGSTICGSFPVLRRPSQRTHRPRGGQRRTDAGPFRCPVSEFEPGLPGLACAEPAIRRSGYPLATPMVRARLTLTDQWTLVTAAFNGDPAGPGPGDPPGANRSGTAFRLQDPVLAFAELWYAVGQGHNRVYFRASPRSGPCTTRGLRGSSARHPPPFAGRSHQQRHRPALPRQLCPLRPH